MPRTPLLRSLQAIWRDVVRARATGVPTRELRELRASRPSRRSILIGGAAAATAIAVAPRWARAAGNKGPSIGIVGGGIAGLTCARILLDHGVTSTVYEGYDRVGGRMFSNRGGYWASSQVSERCGELIDTDHQTIRNLANRYHLTLDDLHKAEPSGSDETYYLAGTYYPKTQADADFTAMFDVISADLKSAPFPTTFDSYTADALALDQMSIYDWIETRVPGGHASPLGQVLDLAYNIEYGAETVDQSSLSLLYLLAYQPNPNTLTMFGASDETYHIRGGNQQLPEAIAADLGDAIVNKGEKLVKIAQTSGGRYTLTLLRAGTTHEVTHDYVVLAIPFAVLADVDTSQAGFDAQKQLAISTLGRGNNGKLHLQFGSRGWLGTGPWPGISNGTSYADTGYQNTWEVTRAQAGTPGILVLYSGGNVTRSMKTTSPFATASDKNVVRDAQTGFAQLAPVYPGLSWNGKATQSLPHLSAQFRNSYSYWKVGQYTTIAGSEKLPQGGVLFCGEHTSIDFQGYMEGGASEGVRAAGDLLKILGKP